jgi:hypothetical protein
MFVMRPAIADDQESIATMIRARSGWMRERARQRLGELGFLFTGLARRSQFQPGLPVRVISPGG